MNHSGQSLSIEDLQQVGSRFGLSLRQAVRVNGGFSGAGVFRATDAAGTRCAIKATPLEKSLPPERLRLLHELQRRLSVEGIAPAAVPGQLVRQAAVTGPLRDVRPPTWFDANDVRWTVEQWLPGEAPAPGAISSTQLAAAVRTLASAYRFLRQFTLSCPVNPWFRLGYGSSEGLARRFQIAERLGEGELARLAADALLHADPDVRRTTATFLRHLQPLLPALQQRLASAADAVLPLQPVVRDLWRSHILFVDSQVTGLIDLTATATDTPVMDAARLLRSWFPGNNQAVAAAFVQFADAVELSSEECRVFPAFENASSVLAAVTWLRRAAQHEPFSSAQRERFRETCEIALQIS